MSITQTLTNVFKQDCLDGAQNLGTSGDTIKIALYTSSATLNASEVLFKFLIPPLSLKIVLYISRILSIAFRLVFLLVRLIILKIYESQSLEVYSSVLRALSTTLEWKYLSYIEW